MHAVAKRCAYQGWPIRPRTSHAFDGILPIPPSSASRRKIGAGFFCLQLLALRLWLALAGKQRKRPLQKQSIYSGVLAAVSVTLVPPESVGAAESFDVGSVVSGAVPPLAGSTAGSAV